MQPGDVPDTYADSARLARAVNWRPATPIAEGVRRFVAWYRDFYGDAGGRRLTRRRREGATQTALNATRARRARTGLPVARRLLPRRRTFAALHDARGTRGNLEL